MKLRRQKRVELSVIALFLIGVMSLAWHADARVANETQRGA